MITTLIIISFIVGYHYLKAKILKWLKKYIFNNKFGL